MTAAMNDPKIEILYEDPALVVAVKPEGLLSQADRSGMASMPEILSQMLNRTVLPIHRLDRGVGGVMAFAGCAAAAAHLSRDILSGRLEKEYLAIVHGIPDPSEGELRDYLRHDPQINRTSVSDKSDRHAKTARLAYRLLGTSAFDGETISLVQVRLYTGRTHQIRVQFSSRDLPLLGDGKYGAHDHCSIGLWSYRLSLRHPETGERLTFCREPVSEIPWTLFGRSESYLNKKEDKI